MHFFNNGWVIGIGTGVVSGLLVTWLLRIFISKKKTREYQQQIASANREIVYSIRTTIPDDALPTMKVIRALIHSTARRYGVGFEELYDPKEIVEELIKEVMDSSFLSSARKVEYCKSLAMIDYDALVGEILTAGDPGFITDASVKETLRLKRTTSNKSERLATVVVGVVTALITAYIYYNMFGLKTSTELKPVLQGIGIALIPLAIISVGGALYAVAKRGFSVSVGELELDELPPKESKRSS